MGEDELRGRERRSYRLDGSVEPNSERELLIAVEDLASRRRLAFPVWLERRFEAETGARYGQLLGEDLNRTAIYYNLFIVGDFMLTPDSVRLAAGLHFLAVTPVMLTVARICRKPLTPQARDIAGGSIPFLIACQILCVFAFTASPTASHYLFFVALNAATVNTSMRLRHRAATWATWATLLLLVATLIATQKIPIEVAVMQVFSFAVCGRVTLRGMADRERDFRRAYLKTLRDRLRIADIDAEANRDPLTGVANRRGLEIAARAAWLDKDRTAPVAVILFDVDRFKAYNDLYGHPAGDLCLKKIAAAAQSLLSRSDALFVRYGGEEFLALLTGVAAGQAEAIAEQLRAAVFALNLVHAGAQERRIVSASFGVAGGTIGECGLEALAA